MKHLFKYLGLFTICTLLFNSCATSNAVIASGVNIHNYKYVVFGETTDGDMELSDIVLMTQNEISRVLTNLPEEEAVSYAQREGYVLTPHINVKRQTDAYGGGTTDITINFHDFVSNQIVAVIKSSGMDIDGYFAIEAIRERLHQVFLR